MAAARGPVPARRQRFDVRDERTGDVSRRRHAAAVPPASQRAHRRRRITQGGRGAVRHMPHLHSHVPAFKSRRLHCGARSRPSCVAEARYRTGTFVPGRSRDRRRDLGGWVACMHVHVPLHHRALALSPRARLAHGGHMPSARAVARGNASQRGTMPTHHDQHIHTHAHNPNSSSQSRTRAVYV